MREAKTSEAEAFQSRIADSEKDKQEARNKIDELQVELLKMESDYKDLLLNPREARVN